MILLSFEGLNVSFEGGWLERMRSWRCFNGVLVGFLREIDGGRGRNELLLFGCVWAKPRVSKVWCGQPMMVFYRKKGLIRLFLVIGLVFA